MFLGQKIVNFVQRLPHLLHEPFVLSFETNVLFANLYHMYICNIEITQTSLTETFLAPPT